MWDHVGLSAKGQLSNFQGAFFLFPPHLQTISGQEMGTSRGTQADLQPEQCGCHSEIEHQENQQDSSCASQSNELKIVASENWTFFLVSVPKPQANVEEMHTVSAHHAGCPFGSRHLVRNVTYNAVTIFHA